MPGFPVAMQRLIRELSRLPSIGERSATRLASFLVSSDKRLSLDIADALKNVVEQVRLCKVCFFLSEADTCSICQDQTRDRGALCIVEKPADVISLERTGQYRGLYHVLHGLWAPLRGQGPESMRLAELLTRIQAEPPREVIIATGSTVEGDATSLYLAKLLGERGLLSSRLAQGMPKGGDLEFADDVTLSRALAGRSPLKVG